MLGRATWCLAVVTALGPALTSPPLDGSNGFVINGIDAYDLSGLLRQQCGGHQR